MKRMRPQPSVLIYNNLLSVTVKIEQYSFALHMFDEMRLRSAPVNVYTFSIAINCYCRLKHVDLGFAIMGILFKSGYEPDVATFNSLMKGLFLDHKVAEAGKLFNKLLRFRICVPNDVMILTMVDGLCKSGNVLPARDLVRRLERSRSRLDVKAYNALLDGLRKAGMVDDAFQLLSRMIDEGISPDVITFVDGWKLFKDMEVRRVCPDIYPYNILLDGLCRNGEIDEALSFLHMIEGKRVNPDRVTYGAVINGLCKNGKHDVARDLFNRLPSRGVLPNARIYTMIIGALCQEGSMEEAKRLFTEMQSRCCAPNSVTYNIMTRSLLKKKELSKAIPYLEEMREKGLSADVSTLSMLIDQMQGQTEDDFLLKLMKDVLSKDIVS